MAVTRMAVIDIGSHELDLEVFDVSASKGIVQVDRIRHAVALGQDTYRLKRISYQVLDEVCKVLNRFVDIMKAYHVSEYRVVGTSALREAENNSVVLDQIRLRTGISVQVLSNSEQRYICYKAVAARKHNFNRLIQKGAAFVDIGSGSMQISLFDKKSLVTTQNFKLGAMRIREMLSKVGDDRTMSHLVGELIDNDLTTFKKMFLKEQETKNVICIGNILFYFLRKLNEDAPEWMSVQEFNEIYNYVLQSSARTMADKLNMPMASASLVLPTMMICKKVIDFTNAEMVWVPDINICDGVIADLADQKKLIYLEHDFSADIVMAALNISKRYMGSKSHGMLMQNNATKIFDSMKQYHGMGKRERLLLQISAVLHDCGKYISMSAPGNCAYDIIMSTEIIGLSHMEREMVANIVRYNTVEFPSYVKFESKMSETQYMTIMKLTAILRIANAMDRSHKQKFTNIKTSVKNQILTITTESMDDISLERVLFKEKADFFEEVFGIRPVLKQKKGVC
ncbi:MAG: HD domain-containing protein [Clostridiales bacterium]|nr:HD domain-containing protein [Clostridiales bacterium]